MATFEERLTKLRTKAGVSQQAIGDALNVSRWAVHNYEAGKNRPDFDGLIALADYFDVSLDYLVGRSDRREALVAARSQEQARPCWNCNRSNIAIDTSEQEQIEPVDKLGESL